VTCVETECWFTEQVRRWWATREPRAASASNVGGAGDSGWGCCWDGSRECAGAGGADRRELDGWWGVLDDGICVGCVGHSDVRERFCRFV
jgi:hypothetical protein